MTPTPMPRIEIPVEPFKQLVNDSITSVFNDPEFLIFFATVIALFVVGAIIAGIGNALGSRRR